MLERFTSLRTRPRNPVSGDTNTRACHALSLGNVVTTCKAVFSLTEFTPQEGP